MGNLEYVKVTYEGKEYCVCKIHSKEREVLFIIDQVDLNRILKHSWFKIMDRYIATKINGKTVHLHMFIKNKSDYEDKEEDTDSDDTNDDNEKPEKNVRITIDHFNRIGMDNRISNLHNATSSEQNINKKGRNRSMELPEDSGISLEDVPKFVWYSKSRSANKGTAKGNIGEYFEVKINTIEGMGNIHWSSASSTDLSLRFKLEHTKKYLRSLREKNPKILNSRLQYISDECIASMKEYNAILRLSKYKCVEANLFPIPVVKDLLIEDTTGLTDKEILLLRIAPIDKPLGKNSPTNMPEDCEITPEMMPPYCYYQQDTERKGEAFYIGKKHPKMNGKKWYTTSDRKVSTKEKFNKLLAKLKELEKT